MDQQKLTREQFHRLIPSYNLIELLRHVYLLNLDLITLLQYFINKDCSSMKPKFLKEMYKELELEEKTFSRKYSSLKKAKLILKGNKPNYQKIFNDWIAYNANGCKRLDNVIGRTNMSEAHGRTNLSGFLDKKCNRSDKSVRSNRTNMSGKNPKIGQICPVSNESISESSSQKEQRDVQLISLNNINNKESADSICNRKPVKSKKVQENYFSLKDYKK